MLKKDLKNIEELSEKEAGSNFVIIGAKSGGKNNKSMLILVKLNSGKPFFESLYSWTGNIPLDAYDERYLGAGVIVKSSGSFKMTNDNKFQRCKRISKVIKQFENEENNFAMEELISLKDLCIYNLVNNNVHLILKSKILGFEDFIKYAEKYTLEKEQATGKDFA